ncbi:MAG: AAA family ATPase [Coriobacteriales bacterium]
MTEQVKISALQLENVKRVRAVQLVPYKDGLTVIGGRNGQGKTSVLDAIAYALGGETFRPSQVQNADGINPATIRVELDNGLVVTRSGKNCALKVTDPSGARSGQRLLDGFVEKLALDLPKFMQQSSREKASAILRTLGIEDRLADIAEREKAVYDSRRDAAVRLDQATKAAMAMPEYPEAPDEPVSVAELMDDLAENDAYNAIIAQARQDIERAKEAIASNDASKQMLMEQIDGLRQRIAALEEESSRLKTVIAENEEIAAEEPYDGQDIRDRIAQAGDVNAKVKANADKREATERSWELKAEHDRLDKQLEGIRDERRQLLASVDMPLEGLSVEDGELLYNGQKWDCMATSEQLVVAVSICHAVNPKCGFVLLDRLEAFDVTQLGKFDEWLRQHNLQAICTRVSTGDECTIVIEDGIVAKDEDEGIGGF